MPAGIYSALIGLVGAIVGGGITSFTTWMIAKAERTKFARERMWDLRRDAYTKIMASIVPAARIAEHMHKEYQKDPGGYDASAAMRQAATEFVTHMRAAQDAYHVNRLMLSAAFAAAFLRMLRSLEGVSADPSLLPPGRAESTTSVLAADSRALLELALSEIDTLNR